MIILDLPFKAGSNECRVAIEASHVDLDIWSAEQHLNYPGVILLNCDDQGSVSWEKVLKVMIFYRITSYHWSS